MEVLFRRISSRLVPKVILTFRILIRLARELLFINLGKVKLFAFRKGFLQGFFRLGTPSIRSWHGAFSSLLFLLSIFPSSILFPSPACAAPDPLFLRLGLLRAQDRVTLSSEGGMILRGGDREILVFPSMEILFSPERKEESAVGVGRLFSNENPRRIPAERFQDSWLVHSLDEKPLLVNGIPYRGNVLVRPDGRDSEPETASDTGLTVVNIVEIEDYLRGVVPNEIGFLRPEHLAAIEAQAIAARTYAIRNLGRHSALGFDLFADHRDQVYHGLRSEHPLSDSAVVLTADSILVIDSAPAEIYYHSTCGGRTSAKGDVWGGTTPVHLRGVSDVLGDTFACVASKYFRWRERYPRSYLGKILGRLPRGFEVFGWDTAGRIEALVIHFADADSLIIGDTIRKVLRRPGGGWLRSTAFQFHYSPSGLELEGKGWGHGVGLCQMGAIGRARAGWNAEEILLHYFPGTRLEYRTSRSRSSERSRPAP
ncbi:MAG: SpoIID/LytB domain-containing protein [Candidatus Hydrogenedentota bacterium]|nr:MAG: SpoIID/LytB domain-containing protein [Candidatus Hydrogenedentota bacterium]